MKWHVVFLLGFALLAEPGLARPKRKVTRSTPVTHPVILWSRTLSESKDLEQRRVAAYKLSQYSQKIFHPSVITTLIGCSQDADVKIKVFCTKALGRAGTASSTETIRAALLDRFHKDALLRNTIVRAFMVRKDTSAQIHETFLSALKTATSDEDRVTLLSYFENFGDSSEKFIGELVEIYKKNEDSKTRRAAIKVLSEKGTGQGVLIDLFSECTTSKDTPLLLMCLDALKRQAKTDKRSWDALTKTIQSEDPDVLLATLDLINVMPETTNSKVAERLLEIVRDGEDPEIQEKAILALGTTGDRGEAIVKVLLKLLGDSSYDETIQIAAALSLGQQASLNPEKAQEFLIQCRDMGKSQSIRTACQLASDDLTARTKRLSHKKEEPRTDEPQRPQLASPAPAVGIEPARPTP